MLLKSNQLLGLPVQEKSGRILGSIKDFEFETDNSRIIKYIVSPSKLVEKFFANDLIIDQSQVIEITSKTMTVDDGLAGSKSVSEEIMAS